MNNVIALIIRQEAIVILKEVGGWGWGWGGRCYRGKVWSGKADRPELKLCMRTHTTIYSLLRMSPTASGTTPKIITTLERRHVKNPLLKKKKLQICSQVNARVGVVKPNGGECLL